MRPAFEAGLMILLEAADPYMRPVLGTGLINPQVVEMPRMRPAFEAVLMVLLEVADPYMRPVLGLVSREGDFWRL